MSPILTIYLEVVLIIFDALNSCFLTHFLKKVGSFELNKKPKTYKKNPIFDILIGFKKTVK
jgi:hypothetical protein